MDARLFSHEMNRNGEVIIIYYGKGGTFAEKTKVAVASKSRDGLWNMQTFFGKRHSLKRNSAGFSKDVMYEILYREISKIAMQIKSKSVLTPVDCFFLTVFGYNKILKEKKKYQIH